MAGAPQATPALNTFGHAQGWPEGLLEVGIWLGGSWPHMCPSWLELGLTAGRDGLGVAGDCCGAEEPLQVGAEPQHEPCRDGCTEHGCTEHSLLCLSRGDTEPTPCPGLRADSPAQGSGAVPHPARTMASLCRAALMLCGERSIRNSSGQEEPVCPPQHTALSPNQPGAHREAPKPPSWAGTLQG